MEQIQNNRVITDLYRENAQFPGIALDGSDVYLCWQRFVDRHDSLMASCRRGDEVVWEREISDGGEVLHPVILAHGGTQMAAMERFAVPHRDYYAWCGPNAGGFVLDAKDWTEKHLLYLVKTVQYTKESRA